MSVLKGKKVPGFYQKPETNKKQINYNRIALQSAIQKKNIEIYESFNPDDQIEEPDPEEHPEDLSCYCGKRLYFFSGSTTGSPEDTEEWWECENGHSTKERLFSGMTPEEVLNGIENGEVPFENSEMREAA